MITRVIALANAKIAASTDPARVRRISSAVELVLDGRVEPLGRGLYRVRGYGGTYDVARGACPCPDSRIRGEVCKHRIAAWLHLTATQPEPQPEPATDH